MPKVGLGVAVAVTSLRQLLFLLLLTLCCVARAGVLPEDRADVMYHSYDGGGMEITGSSVLVRKSIGTSFSVTANHYIDKLSGASIDVEVVGASKYKEERTEKSVGVDYLYNKTTMSLGLTNSVENDFDADSVHFNVSQDLFGDLSTLSFGYSRGNDTIMNSTDASFEREAKRQNYRVSWTQVLTKNMIANLGYEVITDEGYLQNPYRFYRYRDSSTSRGWSTDQENYPNTRTSSAFAVRARYYLSYRAALHAEYRIYDDSWDIQSTNWEVGYTHPYDEHWTFDVRFRAYSQGRAEFFSDLFDDQRDPEDEEDFRGRDKELSKFANTTIGGGATYEFKINQVGFLDKGSVSLFIDRISTEYDDFHDARSDDSGAYPYPAGQEPLYSFDSTVLRFFVSIFY